jgi:hypothetical protein
MIAPAEAKGRELPDWVHKKPVENRGDDFYLSAFSDLGTCRSLSQEMPGPIPWTAIVEYADRAGLESDVSQGFIRIIRAMDLVYLEWFSEKRQKEIDKMNRKNAKGSSR